MRLLDRHKSNLAILAIMFVFALLSLLSTVHTAYTTPYNINTDQLQFGNTVYKALNPSWYSTDFVFKNDYYTGFYTPTFLQSMIGLTAITGDYIQSLALTQFPLTFLYCLFAFMLYQSVTRNKAIAIIFALLTVFGYGALNSEWEAIGLRFILARSYSMPFVMLAVYWLLRIYQNTDQYLTSIREWFIFGILVGLVANFHPTTGMTLALAVGFMALAYTLKTGKPGWICMIVLVIGTFIGGGVTIYWIFNRSSVNELDTFTELTTEDFTLFAEYFENRIRAYPFVSDFGRGWTNESENFQFLVRLPWIILTLGSWLLAQRKQRSLAALFFMATQLVYLWLVVDNLGTVVLIVLFGYSLYKWWQRDDNFVMLMYELSAAMIMVALFIPLVIRPIWWEFELWSFSTVVIEMSRGSRQLTIPITLLLASFARDVWVNSRLMRPEDVWIRFTLVIGVIAGGIPLAILTVVNVAQVVLSNLSIRQVMIRRVVTGILLIVSGGVVLQVGIDILNIVLTESRHETLLAFLPFHYTVLGGVVIGLVAWLVYRIKYPPTSSSEILALTFGLLTIFTVQIVYIATSDYSEVRYNPVDVAYWAKENTDQDALFMFYWDPRGKDRDPDASAFRHFSNRNLIFTHKELNTISYSHPEDLVYHQDRYEFFRDAPYNLSEEEFKALVSDEGINYIVTDRASEPGLMRQYGFNQVYANSDYVVFETGIPPA